MSSSQGTLIQRWNKGCTLTVALLATLLHLAAFALAGYLCPELFTARTGLAGVHCQAIPGTGLEVSAPECDQGDITGGYTRGEACRKRDTGDVVTLQDLRMSFSFPSSHLESDQLSVWNWRLVGSLGISLSVMENHFPVLLNQTEFEQTVLVSASLDYAPLRLLSQERKMANEDCVTASAWHNRAIVLNVNRTLECRLLRKFSSDQKTSDIDINCGVHPFFELLVLSNSSYILQVKLQRSPHSVPELDILTTNATVSSYLTLARETDSFHRTYFYAKCLFTPLVMIALIWFMVRLCLNDLYVTIHDRLLITASLAQILSNIPTEVIVANSPSPLVTLLDPVSHIVLVTSLALYWVVFSLDKLADNEPWERNTRYYWRPLLSISLASVWALLSVLFLRLPPLGNPFMSHWLGGEGPQIYVALGLTFSLAIMIATFHTYISVLVFRVVCDISVRYPGQGRDAWRLKLVLMYCLLVSVVTCLGCILRLAIGLCLHWNSDTVHTDPLPFSMTRASIFYLGEMAATNIHLIILLILLSRSTRGPGDSSGGWYTPVSPVMYSTAPREEQLHLWDLAARTSPL